MGDRLGAYIKQFKELLNHLNKRAKLIIGSGLLVIIIIILLLYLNGVIYYQPLFSQLNSSDADAILKKLEESGIPYQLGDEGRTILVPADQVYKTRLEMAGVGLPNQGIVGFEIFDQSKFGTTDFERKVNFYRALGGELSRSIQALDVVEFAKVQITAPRDSLFIEEEQPAQASVLIKTKPGYKLKESQVRAISNLVASSVQELEPGRVTIIDTAGNLLTDGIDEGSIYSNQLTVNQFEIQHRFEEALESDLRSLLTRVLGPGNFTIQVVASLNFDQREVESKEYIPVIEDEGIIRSYQEEYETYSGEGAQGVPGTSSNIPQYQISEESNKNSITSSNKISNYEINEKIERHVYAPGEVKHLSVAVIVNDSLRSDVIRKIKEVVEAAIGYDTARGDIVTVTGLAFDNTLEQEIAQAEAVAREKERNRMFLHLGLTALIAIIILIIIFLIRRSRRNTVKEMTPGKALNYIVGKETDELAATEFTKEDRKRQKQKEEIGDIISEKPEEVAHLLKSWLMED